MAKIRHIMLCVAVGVMSAVVVYLLAALVLGLMEIHADRDEVQMNNAPISIYLVSNGVHTDIVMPMSNDIHDWQTIVNPLHSRSGQMAQYVGIGWGDKTFYLESPTWADLRPSLALKSLLGLDETAMHVTFYPTAPQPDVDSIQVQISALEYERLVESIVPSFQLDANGQAIHIPYAYYHDSDAFYEARGQYHLFHTCNTWTNERLKKSGLKAVVWTPFASSLMNAYR